VTKQDAYCAIVDAVDRMVNRGAEADRLLRDVVDLLVERLPHVSWAGIRLVEGGELILGPQSGTRAEAARVAVPIAYEGREVGELALEADRADAFDAEDQHWLERVAMLISQHALVGWDTAGEAWNP
jgi:putative methionine-R-sulfoxide reductase with GAF domain